MGRPGWALKNVDFEGPHGGLVGFSMCVVPLASLRFASLRFASLRFSNRAESKPTRRLVGGLVCIYMCIYTHTCVDHVQVYMYMYIYISE